MLRRIRSAARAVGLLALIAPALSAAPASPVDTEETILVDLHLDPRPEGGYRLSADREHHRVFRTERSLEGHAVTLYEPSYAPINRLEGAHGKDELYRNQVLRYVPRRTDQFIPSGHLMLMEFGTLHVGDEVHWSIHQEYADPGYLEEVEIPADPGLKRFQLIVDHPKEVSVEFALACPAGEVRHKVLHPEAGQTALVVVAPEPVPSLPALAGSGRRCTVAVRLERDGVRINPSTPEAFAAWYLKQVGPAPEANEAMRALLATELGAAKSAREKARILYDWVKREVRYLADEGEEGAYLPRRPDQVLERRYGDCKDKAFLLAALGKLHGLKILPVLVGTSRRAELPDTNMASFNHVIDVLDDQGELVFMDATDAKGELGVLPSMDLLSRALVLDPERPLAIELPGGPEQPSLELVITGAAASPATARARVTLRQSLRDTALDLLDPHRSIDGGERIARMVERVVHRLSLRELHAVKSDRESVELEGEVDLRNFLFDSGRHLYLPSVPFRTIDSDWLQRRGDHLGLEVGPPMRARLELRLDAPNYRLKQSGLVLGGAGGANFEAHGASEGNELHLRWSVAQPYRFVPDSGRAAFLAFCEQLLESRRQVFAADRSQP